MQGGSVLNRMYGIFDTLGCKAGLSLEGKWITQVDGKDKPISDIGEYLTERFTTGNVMDMEHPYVAYVYKSQPKPNEKQSYTRVLPRLYHATSEGKLKLASDVKYLKSKGMLVELDETKEGAKPHPVLKEVMDL